MEKITRNQRTTGDENPKNKEVEKVNEEKLESFQEVTEETAEIKIENNIEESESFKTQSEETPVSEDFKEQEPDNTDDVLSEIKPSSSLKKKTTHKREKNKKKINYGKIIGYLITLAIAGLVVFGVVKGANFVIDYISQSIEHASPAKEITINSTGSLAYEKFQKGVLIANEGTVSYHNSKNDVVWEKSAFSGSPVIKTNDRYALVSYTGTPNALLVNGPDTIPVTGNGKIVTSCINKNGYFALVMSEEGYKNQIVVFDNNGHVIYKWHSAENYVTCVAISPDNKNMAASTIGFGGDKFTNGVMIFDFAQEKPYAGQQEEENIIMSIDYVSKKRFVVIGDKNATYYKTNGKKIRTIDYEGRKLTTYDVCDGGNTVLCFSKDDSAMSSSDIYSYNTRGRQAGHFETESRVLSVSCDKDEILVARERVFDVLSDKCRKKNSVQVLKDIKNSVLFDGGKKAFVISGNTGHIVKVR
jgi:hypothetical protein